MIEEDNTISREPVLRTEGISRIVDIGNGSKKIISDFSFEFIKGRKYTVLGPSGAGKSSLLRLFNRLDETTDGRITFNGIDIREMDPCGLRREIGYLFQTPYMFPETVKDNLLFADPTLSDEQIISMLSKVNLDHDYLNADVEVLSLGEKQRIAFTRLIALDAKILLLDEPTSALDEKNAELILGLINDTISENGVTVIIVTHDPGQATKIEGEALLIIKGRLVEHGPAKKLIANPATETGRLFLKKESR